MTLSQAEEGVKHWFREHVSTSAPLQLGMVATKNRSKHQKMRHSGSPYRAPCRAQYQAPYSLIIELHMELFTIVYKVPFENPPALTFSGRKWPFAVVENSRPLFPAISDCTFFLGLCRENHRFKLATSCCSVLRAFATGGNSAEVPR